MQPVNTLSEFVAIVNRIQSKWTEEANDEFIFPWFRGHQNSSMSLLPSLYRRNDIIDNEDSYRHDFKLKAYPFLSDAFGVLSTEWDWYFIMQHYGLPTRLLDWTEGSLIALYFALFYKSDEDDSNPCVWMLNPFLLNKYYHKTDMIFSIDDALADKYLPEIWSNSRLPKAPLAIQPSFKSKRIAAQKGCFTIHGNDQTPFEKEPALKKFLIKIEINYVEIELIMDEILVSGISESTLFPELAGLCRELKYYWRK